MEAGGKVGPQAWRPIPKRAEDIAHANLKDYRAAPRGRSSGATRGGCWTACRAAGLNIAYEAIDRHVDHGRGAKVALRWIGQDGTVREFTYEALRLQTNRFANLLRGLGIEKGDRVYSLLGRRPELYIAALGTLKAGCVFCPLFSAFGPEPITVAHGDRRSGGVDHHRGLLPAKGGGLARRARQPSPRPDRRSRAPPLPEGTLDLPAMLEESSDSFEIVRHEP